MKTFKILISLIFLIATFQTHSQDHNNLKFKMPEGSRAVLETIQLSDGEITASELVNCILPAGTAFSNVSFTGPQGMGIFSGGTGINLALNEGVVFGSGCINMLGQGELDCDNMGLSGDAQLNSLGPTYSSNDAAYLEFDFVPEFTNLEFRVIYGSSESSSYYGEPSGIFLDGSNIAFIPESNIEISNLTLWNTPYYHVNNDIGTILYMYSDVITVSATVTPNVSHHLKIAISDSDDQVVPSFLFVEGDANINLVPVAWWSVALALALILGFTAYRFMAIHRG